MMGKAKKRADIICDRKAGKDIGKRSSNMGDQGIDVEARLD